MLAYLADYRALVEVPSSATRGRGLTVERLPVDLSGVPATLLSNLGRRAAAARAKRPLLKDSLAVEAVERLDYDFAQAPRGVSSHALRVATSTTRCIASCGGIRLERWSRLARASRPSSGAWTTDA